MWIVECARVHDVAVAPFYFTSFLLFLFLFLFLFLLLLLLVLSTTYASTFCR